MRTETPAVSAGPDPRPRSRLFLFLFTNIWFLSAVATLWTILAIVTSLRTTDWTWFARSGSVDAILGGILTSRSVLRLSPAERVRIRHMTVVETFTAQEFQDQERDSLAVQLGVFLLVGGTLIWAYGDLLPRAFAGA